MADLFMSSEVDFAEKQLNLLAWLENNKSKLVGALVGAIAIGVVIASMNASARNAENAASTALAALGAMQDEKGERKEATGAEYLAVANAHPGTGAAERALILSAGALFEEEDFAGA